MNLERASDPQHNSALAKVERPLCHNILMRARDLMLNWLGHVLLMEEHRLLRQVLLTCVKPTSVSILADIPSLDIRAAIRIAADRVEWKRLGPSRRC